MISLRLSSSSIPSSIQCCVSSLQNSGTLIFSDLEGVLEIVKVEPSVLAGGEYGGELGGDTKTGRELEGVTLTDSDGTCKMVDTVTSSSVGLQPVGDRF